MNNHNPDKNKGYKLIKKNTRKLLPYQAGTFVLAFITISLTALLINYLQALIDMLQLQHSGGDALAL